METSISKEISAWFSQHCDVEFVGPDRRSPFHVIGPSHNSGRVVYSTKPSVLFQSLEKLSNPEHVGVISQYGLPDERDIDWILGLVESRELLFIGDLDPPDLLIFAWLRGSLDSIKVTHLGISDGYLQYLNADVPIHYRIKLSESEEAALPLLRQVFPDLLEVVGVYSAGILEGGNKIEIEAVVSTLGSVESILLPISQRSN